MKDLDDAIKKYYKNELNYTEDSKEVKKVLDEMLLLNEVDIPIKLNISNMIEQVENKKAEEELRKNNIIFLIFTCVFCIIIGYCLINFTFWKVFLYEFIICAILSPVIIIGSNRKHKTTI